MNCTNCGKQIADGSKFCPECGAAVTAQSVETMTGEIVETAGNAPGPDSTAMAAVEIRRFNIGHFGVLVAGLLTLVAAFIPNSGNLWGYSILKMLSWNGNGDGRTYVMILAILLIATIVTACLRKNMLMVIGSIVSMVWILYMYTTCEESFLHGMGLLLFLLGGILLVISAVAALVISRKNADRQMGN